MSALHPLVAKCLRQFDLDPLKGGPWIVLHGHQLDQSLDGVPSLQDTPLMFSEFRLASEGETGLDVFSIRDMRSSGGGILIRWDFEYAQAPADSRRQWFEFRYTAMPDGAHMEVVGGSAPALLSMRKEADREDTARVTLDEVRARLTALARTSGTTHASSLVRRPPNARGKSTGFEWVTVEIKPPAPEAPPGGGTHASPRAHDRRGHWVRRGDKQFWRKACRVGDPRDGFVFHTYVTSGVTSPSTT